MTAAVRAGILHPASFSVQNNLNFLHNTVKNQPTNNKSRHKREHRIGRQSEVMAAVRFLLLGFFFLTARIVSQKTQMHVTLALLHQLLFILSRGGGLFTFHTVPHTRARPAGQWVEHIRTLQLADPANLHAVNAGNAIITYNLFDHVCFHQGT